jgi:hypothetical protein
VTLLLGSSTSLALLLVAGLVLISFGCFFLLKSLTPPNKTTVSWSSEQTT